VHLNPVPKAIYNAFPDVRALFEPFECLWLKQVFMRGATGDITADSVLVSVEYKKVFSN
jgi:hypothetical protein